MEQVAVIDGLLGKLDVEPKVCPKFLEEYYGATPLPKTHGCLYSLLASKCKVLLLKLVGHLWGGRQQAHTLPPMSFSLLFWSFNFQNKWLLCADKTRA